MKPKRTFPNSVLQSRSIAVERLHRLTVCGRWLTVVVLWLSIGAASLWNLRDEIELWTEHFTWVSVLYALIFHPLSTLGFSFCLAMTLSVLVWQSRNILWGLSRQEELRLVRQVRKIRAAGSHHLLWNWVIGK